MSQTKMEELPLIPLRGLTIFPIMVLSFSIGRTKSVEALERTLEATEQKIFLVTQKDAAENEPGPAGFNALGTVAIVKQVLRMPDHTVHVIAEGVERAAIDEVIQEEPYFIVKIKNVEENAIDENDLETVALMRNVAKDFEKYVKLFMKSPPEIILSILSTHEAGELSDLIASSLQISVEEKQQILEILDHKERLFKISKVLKKELAILIIQKEINLKVKQNVDKTQKEYFLKEQLKVIQEELGEKEATEQEAYKNKIAKLIDDTEIAEKLLKEVDRLAKISTASPESSVIRNYLDYVLDLPWQTKTKESKDIKRAENILNKDHYGLEKVKERILEYLAVRQNAPQAPSPILCLVGPPGVGKTSVAKSVAKSLNRKYIRISLGGVRDEADIRGHRKTYIGAMPGRIMTSIRLAKNKNPLFLLDEIDKVSHDSLRGDPSSALLEVLDSEQNFAFADHFLEVPFDLSDCLFMCTANTVETIPAALRDRLEIIHLDSYTLDEKLNIAQKYLVQKQLKKHGLKKYQLKIADDAILSIINHYAKESGVRQLERLIGQLCRKTVKAIVSNETKSLHITAENVAQFLGAPKYFYDEKENQPEIGLARGLAWTSIGGDTLSIEAGTMKGSGKFELTGNMGDIMKESAQTAIGYIRSKAAALKIDPGFYKQKDIHIHIPEGATPKDGPSAGITMAVAIVSALSNIPVKNDVAMTGEITLRGRVLPIGGLKEKVLAAKRAGITKVLLPKKNERDLMEIPETAKEGMTFTLVGNMDEVLAFALVDNVFQTVVKS